MLKIVGTAPEEHMDDYEATSQKYTEVRQRLTDIEAEIVRLENPDGTAIDDDPLDRAAEAYLTGPPQGASFTPLLERLRDERVVVERAVGIARRRLRAAGDARNNEVVKSLRPAHCKAAERVAACVIQLAEANAEEARVRQQAPGGALPFLSYPGVDTTQGGKTKHFLTYLKRTYNIEPARHTAAAE